MSEDKNNELENITDESDSIANKKNAVNDNKTKNKKKGLNPFKNKKFKYGGLSVAFTLIFVSVVVLLNVIVNTLLSRFDLELDLTENKLYSIEESTEEYLKNLDDEVSIIICSDEIDYTATGLVYQQANAIAGKFNSINPNVEIKYVNLLKNPAFSGQYGNELTNVSVVIESKKTERYKVLQYNEYCDITYYTSDGEQLSYEEASFYSQYMQIYTDVSASAEQAFLSAIMSVCDVNPVRVAFASGFGEGYVSGSSSYLNEAFEALLDKNAYVVETIDLVLTNEIDPAIDFLVIFAPTSDYDIKSLTMIDNWLDNNGMLQKNVIYVASLQNAETPNLDGFINDWGMSLEKGYIYQTDTSYANAQSGYEQNMLLQESDYTNGITNGRFISYMLRPVTMFFEERSNLIVTPILSSYNGAVTVPFDIDENWTPDLSEKTVLHGIVESKKTAYTNGITYSSRVIVAGGPYIFASGYLNATNISNSSLYMNIFNTISGKEKSVTLNSKSFKMTSFEITAETSNTIGIIFAIVLPLLISAAGITVFLRRRYK